MLKKILRHLSFLSPKGRCDRLTWWIVTIPTAIGAQLALVFGVLIALQGSPLSQFLGFSLAITFGLIGLWLPFMIAARRFRDIGYSPWLTLLYFIPPLDGDELYLSWIPILIICGFFPSKGPRKNKKITRIISKQVKPSLRS